jgi:hypothetical protein
MRHAVMRRLEYASEDRTFVVLTFGLTWTLWALVLRVASTATGASHVSPLLALGGPVFLIGVFAPGLVAVALTALTGGGSALIALLGRVGRWRVSWKFYAFALLLMPLTKLTVAIVYRAMESSWPAWHLPLFFTPGADTNGQSFPLYALQVMAYSVAIAWLYWRTGGSLLLTMFMHAAFNNMKDIVPSGGVGSGSPFTFESTLVFRLTVLILWVAGVVLLVRMRGVRRLAQRREIAATADQPMRG